MRSQSEPPSKKRLSAARHAGEGVRISASVSFSTQCGPRSIIHVIGEERGAKSKGMRDRTGVPVNIVECKKPQEKGRRIPAKDLSTPRARLALPPGNEKRASGSGGGSREKGVISAWKRRSQSLSRREGGVSVFGPAHHGKAPVDVAFGRHAGPTSRRSHRRMGNHSRRASRGALSAAHHE